MIQQIFPPIFGDDSVAPLDGPNSTNLVKTEATHHSRFSILDFLRFETGALQLQPGSNRKLRPNFALLTPVKSGKGWAN